jgi:nitrogen fixation NifU-like protein
VTSSLDDLYRATILDHGKSPRNTGRLDAPTHTGECDNPLCGDRVRVEVIVEGERLRAAGFEITGCIIATASASLMTEAVAGRSLQEIRALHDHVAAMCTGDVDPDGVYLGPLAALAGVRVYPSRALCATLPWEALARALGHAATASAAPS